MWVIFIILIQEVDKLMKKTFYILTFLGIIIIEILSFILPSNPYEIIPAISYRSFDKPLWSCYLFGGNFIYTLLLWNLYDTIQNKKKEK